MPTSTVAAECSFCERPRMECHCEDCECGNHPDECTCCEECQHSPCQCCEQCGCYECQCCEQCGCYECQCCGTCGYHYDECRCCGECECYPCQCEPTCEIECDYWSERPAWHDWTFDQFRPRRSIGLEIEIAAWDDPWPVQRACEHIGARVDSEHCGAEVVLPPLRGDQFVDAVEGMAAALHDAGATVSTECGLHCHVGASDYARGDLRRLIVLWAKVEPALLCMVARSRRNNGQYCARCAEHYLAELAAHGTYHLAAPFCLHSPNRRKSILRSFRKRWSLAPVSATYGSTDTRCRKGSKWDTHRYRSLNLHSWFHRQTFEVRLHHGTTSAHKMISWARTCASLVDYALCHEERELAALPSDPVEALFAATDRDAHEWIATRLNHFNAAAAPVPTSVWDAYFRSLSLAMGA